MFVPIIFLSRATMLFLIIRTNTKEQLNVSCVLIAAKQIKNMYNSLDDQIKKWCLMLFWLVL